ncbi:hypothetical protein BDW74DRAFT_149659 [Aspergillus multicolor]|uniref:uncharacterized protein n=1 Tax=Aspergillus multicolor TaxID=41759 RepID=UPI003CCCB90D
MHNSIIVHLCSIWPSTVLVTGLSNPSIIHHFLSAVTFSFLLLSWLYASSIAVV